MALAILLKIYSAKGLRNKITQCVFTVKLDGCCCSGLIKGPHMLFDAGCIRVRDFIEAGQDNLCVFVLFSFL